MRDRIEIALASDAGYFCGLFVTACSIARSCHSDVILSFNILDGGLEDAQKELMERRVRDFHSDSSFCYLPVNDELFKDYPAWHGNKMAYARLMLPTALPEVDWIIYCDVDFLWLRDIAELWAERDDRLAFVGVQDLSEVTRKSEKVWFEQRGYPFDMDDYFCSGLCFMNLKAFREEHLVDRIMEVLDKHKDIQFPDQAALNIVTWGRRKLVDGRWQRFARNLTQADLDSGVVIHHAGAIPWKLVGWLFSPLPDAIMLWHLCNAEFRGVSVFQSLRMWMPTTHIVWHRAMYYLLQIAIARSLVRVACELLHHEGVWCLLEMNSRRLSVAVAPSVKVQVPIKSLCLEFMRYVVVGGIAFISDFGALVASQELVFKSYSLGVYAATVVGFIVGLTVNYYLSLIFVFTSAKDRGKGRSVGAFLVFGIIGLVGLGLTELGMWLGVAVLTWNYMIVKALVTIVVLAWNFLGRKLIIFR